MKYLMIDISGKVPKYDIALCEAMASSFGECADLTLLAANIYPKKIKCHSRCLISLIPQKYQNSENKVKRLIKAIEGVLNYIYVVLYALLTRPRVIHFQWLPFLEVSSIEHFFLRLIKIVSPKSKILLTIHNIYPHNSGEKARNRYKSRFNLVEKFFDKFILHLQTSKDVFCKEFGIDSSRCKVIPHGVFEPENLKITSHKRDDKLRLVMYGNQSYYKGTDILVDAITMLPNEIQKKVCTTIVGKTAEKYLNVLQTKAKGRDIKIIPEYVSDNTLNQIILDSDAIVLPYREISQSGVLLLALYFERPIICSDLPSFRETLGSPFDDLFFESGNSRQLANVLERFFYEQVDVNAYLTELQSLKNIYSWATVAKYYKEEIE